MICPHCHTELPAAPPLPKRCPACGKNPGESPPLKAVEPGPGPVEGSFLTALRIIGLVILVAVGSVMAIVGILFAGCLCSGMHGLH